MRKACGSVKRRVGWICKEQSHPSKVQPAVSSSPRPSQIGNDRRALRNVWPANDLIGPEPPANLDGQAAILHERFGGPGVGGSHSRRVGCT